MVFPLLPSFHRSVARRHDGTVLSTTWAPGVNGVTGVAADVDDGAPLLTHVLRSGDTVYPSKQE
jgi:hypothetical protein